MAFWIGVLMLGFAMPAQAGGISDVSPAEGTMGKMMTPIENLDLEGEKERHREEGTQRLGDYPVSPFHRSTASRVSVSHIFVAWQVPRINGWPYQE